MLAMLQTCGATGQPVNFEVLRLLNDVDLQKAAVATFGEEAQVRGMLFFPPPVFHFFVASVVFMSGLVIVDV